MKLWKRVAIGISKAARLLGFQRIRQAPPRRRRKGLGAPPALAPALLPAPIEAREKLPPVLVSTAIDEFSGVQLSTHTQRAYRNDLRDFFAFLKTQGIWKNWNDEVTPVLVAQYRAWLVGEKKLAKGSVTRKMAVLKSFFRWGQSRGWVEHNPAELVRGFPQTQESRTGFLDDKEIDELLTNLNVGSDERLSRHLARVVVETLLMLALRRSEATRLRAGDLEYLDGRWLIRVRGKGDRDRSLPVPPRLLQTWSTWWARLSEEAPQNASFNEDPAAWMSWARRHAEQPLLVSTKARNSLMPLSSSEVAWHVRKAARRAGLMNRVSPHMLRATAITHALDQGASHRGVQQMAGWTSPLMITRYDKRRRDPRFSAVDHLAYAKVADRPPAG